MSKRDEILSVAKSQFARQGYSETSMRHIADESGLLAGSLYSHFRSKTEMVGDIVSGFYAELIPRQLALLETEGTGLDQFGRMLREVFDVCAEHHDELTILHYDWHILSTLADLDEVRKASLETLRLWRTVIERGKNDGSINPGLDTDALVRIATSSIHALIDTVRYADRPLKMHRREDLAHVLESVLLGGVGGTPSKMSTSKVAGGANLDGAELV